MVWHFHLFQNLPQFIVSHTVKPEIGVLLFVCLFVYGIFLIFQRSKIFGLWISGCPTFPKTRLNIWKFMVHIFLKPGLENIEHYLLECEMSVIVW